MNWKMRKSRNLALFFVALGVAMGTGSFAHADTIDLICSRSSEAADISVSIDTSANTATFWSNGMTRKDATSDPATITNSQVSWSYSSPIVSGSFTLDRASGVLNEESTSGIKFSWTCSKAT
jgi:hypothetical protein